jgi:hypothetical protein
LPIVKRSTLPECSKPRLPAHQGARKRLTWLLCAGLVAYLGCGSDSSRPARTTAAKTAPKPDFEQLRLLTSPNDGVSLQGGIKPGHWTGVVVEDVANNFDFRGELTLELLDPRGQPLEVEGTPYRLQTKRPVKLPKEQMRRLDATLFLPASAAKPKLLAHEIDTQTIPQFSVASRLFAGAAGREFAAVRATVNAMPDFQFFFVVLAHEPLSYRWLLKQQFVTDPCGEVLLDPNTLRPEAQYRVIAPLAKQRPALPAHALAWTPVA